MIPLLAVQHGSADPINQPIHTRVGARGVLFGQREHLVDGRDLGTQVLRSSVNDAGRRSGRSFRLFICGHGPFAVFAFQTQLGVVLRCRRAHECGRRRRRASDLFAIQHFS